ncbi:MAG: hypothetical protein ACLR0V_06340 [Roseburia hominis]
MNLKKENKKHSVWLSESAWIEVESRYQRDNCSTRNEFIERPSGSIPVTWTQNLPMLTCPGSSADVLEGKLRCIR